MLLVRLFHAGAVMFTTAAAAGRQLGIAVDKRLRTDQREAEEGQQQDCARTSQSFMILQFGASVQTERDDVRARRDRNVVVALEAVGDRRCGNLLARIEEPKGLA